MRRREFIAGLGRAAVAVPNRKHGVSPAANFDCIAHRARRWTRARVRARTVFKPSPTRLQRIPVKLIRSRRGGSSCRILHEKVSVRKHRRVGIEYEWSARKTFADRL